MKKIYCIITACTILLFTSCLDTEEKIALNEDGSGDYAITMDMGKMMGMLSAFNKEDNRHQKKDTVIYFKQLSDTSTVLSAEEKEIMRTGKLTANVDTENGQMKFVMDARFKNAGQLEYLRMHFPEMVEKIKAMSKVDGDEKKPASEESEVDMSALGQPKMNPGKSKAINPFKDYYEFKVNGNSLIYQLKDKEAAIKAMETNEDFKMMKQMAPMMGEMTISTKIILPRPALKAEGVNAKLSDDKKTVTVTANLSDIIKNLEAMAFKVEY